MYPHRIRLRGPWECQALARRVLGPDGSVELTTLDLPPVSRLTMPARWRDALGDFAGRVRFCRRFGLPRRLDDCERVWLTFGGITGSATISLNGKFLGSQTKSDEPFEFDVATLLKERNELVVEVESAAPSGGLWGEVALEIRRTAFLRGVQIEVVDNSAQVKLQVRGAVAGTCPKPLEIYVIAGRSTVAYATVEAGSSFALVSEPLSRETWQQASSVRVELVEGGIVWYCTELAASRVNERSPSHPNPSPPHSGASGETY